MGVCNCSMFCCTLLYVHSSIAITLMGKRELIALLICLPGVSWWLSGTSSRCHRVVCSLWLWYFLIILTYYFLLREKNVIGVSDQVSIKSVCSVTETSLINETMHAAHLEIGLGLKMKIHVRLCTVAIQLECNRISLFATLCTQICKIRYNIIKQIEVSHTNASQLRCNMISQFVALCTQTNPIRWNIIT